MKDISPSMANLVGRLCSTLLYGINIVVYGSCVYVLYGKRTNTRICWFLFTTATIQFIISTIHIGVSWRMLIEAFIQDADIPGTSVAYWIHNPSKVTDVITKGIPIVNSILADVILIWRLYVIWARNRFICILPSIIVLAYTITFLVGVGKLSNLNGQDFFAISQYGVAGYGMSAVAHVSVTLLIVGKIWWTARGIHVIHPSFASSIGSAVWIVLESGAVYSITTIFVVVFGSLKTWIGGLILDIVVQVAELIPTLIIVRAGLRHTSDNTTSMLTTFPLEFSTDNNLQISSGTFSAETLNPGLKGDTYCLDAKFSV
ncbi:hypothetical protein L208DRAFT_1444698 [Tricholoma matsutake]|nr:hypothetical protein L208DRAFT_1445483 [Tricholoma matsutake 945]KAF8224312.1 hypothetical protein L208DRAFT_1444698 [Tricholoma matsutake 945]